MNRIYLNTLRFVAADSNMILSSNWTDGDLVGVMKRFADIEDQLSILTFNFKDQSVIEHNHFTDVLKGITDINKVTSALADKYASLAATDVVGYSGRPDLGSKSIRHP